ncbi:MAG: HEAT repeat domain-containing protein [Chitinophagaceae bacterium]|nr:HEAT repeat domain-containing protein [Anaerolineae bacterium]
MTLLPKVIEYHINRLKDKNPDIRMKAIKELELLGHPDAMVALKSVYEEDDDDEVRKAAKEAGRTIFLKQMKEKSGE